MTESQDLCEVSMLTAWSHSRLKVYEQCARRAKLTFVDRIPEPPRPLPPGKTEQPGDRGVRLHTAAEQYVRGDVPDLHPELEAFRPEFENLRKRFQEGSVSLEGEWGIDREWKPIDWRSPDCWSRMKLDAFVMLHDTHAVVIDYKSGKYEGNEISHSEQGQLYQLAAFLRYPSLNRVDVEFWYLDHDYLSFVSYNRLMAGKFLSGWTARGNKFLSEEIWKPNPNRYSCRWCPFKPQHLGGTGHCEVGV